MIVNLRLDELRTIWHQFWRSTEGPSGYQESQLSKSQLTSLCEKPGVCQFVELADRSLYQALLEVIISDSLKAMPANLIHVKPPISVTELHAEVCGLLTNRATLSTWTAWLDQIVARSLANRVSGPKRANAARQLMLVWTYYSSLLMRELTLRSAVSFSSCHLLRMLCDEYLSYRLEQVASSPLTPLPRISESLSETHPVDSLDMLSQPAGLIEHTLIAGEQANTLTSLNDTNFCLVDSQILAPGYPCLRSAIRQFNPSLINTKLTVLSGFTKGLRRALGLTHLSQAVVGVIRDPERLRQMLCDIKKLDLDSIERQGSWASDCPFYREQRAPLHTTQLAQSSNDTSNDFSSTVDFESLLALPINPLGGWESDLGKSAFMQHSSMVGSQTRNQNSITNVGNTYGSAIGLTSWTDQVKPPISVTELHAEVCGLLTNRATLSTWTAWLDQIVARSLANRVSGPKRANAARQLMLFSLGFCGDPLLTESNSLVSDKAISLSDITDNWTNPDSLSTVVTNSGLSYPLHERPLTPQTNGLGSEYFNSPNLGPVSGNDMCTSELNSTIGVNPKSSETPEPSTENRPPSTSGCVTQSRSHRKPLKQQLSRFQEPPKLFENQDTDETVKCAGGTFKMEQSEWLGLSSSQSDHSTQGVVSSSILHEVSPASRRFMKPFSSHVEKRIVASLHEEIQENSNIQVGFYVLVECTSVRCPKCAVLYEDNFRLLINFRLCRPLAGCVCF
ncbi:hypothetical protein AHF37_09046 [Paragonimus kellicotti]|nr:hypothetical protein AHF37_09046 [Paragonimus kellicotti]